MPASAGIFIEKISLNGLDKNLFLLPLVPGPVVNINCYKKEIGLCTNSDSRFC